MSNLFHKEVAFTDRLSIVFPTRNRPNNIRRLYQSLIDTCTVLPEVVLYIDDDDKVSMPVAKELGIAAIQGPRRMLAECYNEIAYTTSSDLIMYAADDLVFRTKNWDSAVRQVFNRQEDRILVVHGDDKSHGHTEHATHGILHRRWVETVGYFLPPYFGAWVDNWITAVANALGRRVYVPFVNEHMHYTSQKAPLDATYEESRPRQSADTEKYKNLKNKRLEDIQKLWDVMSDKTTLTPIQDIVHAVQERKAPALACCPSCQAVCVVVTNGRNQCNQCGRQFNP